MSVDCPEPPKLKVGYLFTIHSVILRVNLVKTELNTFTADLFLIITFRVI